MGDDLEMILVTLGFKTTTLYLLVLSITLYRFNDTLSQSLVVKEGKIIKLLNLTNISLSGPEATPHFATPSDTCDHKQCTISFPMTKN